MPRQTHRSPSDLRLRRAHVPPGPLALLGLGMAVGAAGAALAQETAESGPVLQEITVTATRRAESLSKVPISITALSQDSIDVRGIKDIQDVARFTPGINVDNTGTNNISIRGISSSGGAGTTGIYIDDTPIQMRALAFNPDETLPKSFDIERVEVLRGPQGTLFGAGSEGGTVRYITAQPNVHQSSLYARSELAYTQNADPSYEAGVAVGGPIIDGKLGARISVWYRRDGGWIDRADLTGLSPTEKFANYADNSLIRLAGLWQPNENWSVTPSIYYQKQQRHDQNFWWPALSDPGSGRFVNGNPEQRNVPDTFYLPALKIQGDLGFASLISNTSYYHRENTDGYSGTMYNLGFYQTFNPALPPLSDLNAPYIHLPAGAQSYRSPASVDNFQQNITEEVRLQSNDPNARVVWTTGVFLSWNRQRYLEQIHDPMLATLSQAYFGLPIGQVYTDLGPLAGGNPVPYDLRFPDDSYFLLTNSKDQQQAVFGEASASLFGGLKLTLGARYSWTKFSFDTLTGGPQLFAATTPGGGANKETKFTPRASLQWQINDANQVYATYAKGFRPGGANNPLPPQACGQDFTNFGIKASPTQFSSDTVDSYELGAKNTIASRFRIASSIYYIKWNNIQQTVVPPICAISFIDNLGQAVAWGGDIQADWAVTDSFTAELSAGYTDSRYTKDSKFPSQNLSVTKVIVHNGDAIVGQSGSPNAPFTTSVGLEYHFDLLGHKHFIRGDYEYQAHSKWSSPRQDPLTSQYNAAYFTLPSTSFASVRAGTYLDDWTVSFFVDNLANTHTVTGYSWDISAGSTAAKYFTFRPRTFGFTAVLSRK